MTARRAREWAAWPNRRSRLAVIVAVTGWFYALIRHLSHGLHMEFRECSRGAIGQMHRGVG